MTGRPSRRACAITGAAGVVLALLAATPGATNGAHTGRRAGRARVAEPLRPGPQGLRRHRPQRRLEGVVHRRRRRALRRLRADDRQHQRPHAAVRRHRRPQLHRPPEPRPDLHGQQRPLRHGVHGGRHQRRARLHASPPATSPTPPATASSCTPGCRDRHTSGLKVYARLDAIVNGNGGGGSTNGGADSGVVTSSGVPVVSDPPPSARRPTATTPSRPPWPSPPTARARPRSGTPTPPPTGSPASTPPTASRRTPARRTVTSSRPRRSRRNHGDPGVHPRPSASAARQDAGREHGA